MAKHKKRSGQKARTVPSAWRIPEPTPGDDINQPDRTKHLEDLMMTIVRKRCGTAASQKKRGLTNAEIQKETSAVVDACAAMYTAYHARLMQQDEYLTEQELERLDRIDLSGTDLQSNRDEIGDSLDTYLRSLPQLAYATIPCYEEGCLYMNSLRRIHFKLMDIDLDADTVKVFLRDYQKDGPDGAWGIGVSGEVSLRARIDGPSIVSTFGIDDDRTEQFKDIYSRIPPRELGWNAEQVKLWERTILQNAVDQLARFRQKDENPVKSLAAQFHYAILIVNMFLSGHKPKIEKPAPAGRTTERSPSKSVPGSIDPEAPRIRTVGTVRFVSAKPPRQATEQTVRKYTLASWPTRGHTRTYKNGRTVYIKPTVHHRRSLKDASQAQENPQSILRIKNTDRQRKD